LGIALDEEKNQAAVRGRSGPIHSAKSRVAVLVIPTNEELEIARQVVDLLAPAG
jgi:acetate kinase